jgi:NHLM bacteriocin system ABC transporter peptidase/ATP-binding protein
MKSRLKTPNLLQMEAVECGAACLGMILAYYGRYVPLEQLRYDCDVTRDGSKAGNVLKAARSYHLQAKGLKKEAEDLIEIQTPAIIHWNFNHFVVLEGIDRTKNKVYLNDPAEGHRVVDWQTLTESFTGVVLTFEAAPEFQKGGEKPNIQATLMRRLYGYKVDLVFVVLVGMLLLIPGLLIPLFSQVFIDNILIEGVENWFVPLLIGMAITAVLRGLLEALKNKYLLRLETKMSLATASQFFWHVLRLPIDFFQQRYAGDIGARVETNDHVAHLILGEFAKNVLNLLLVVFYFLLMCQYSLILSVISLAFAGLNVLVLRLMAEQRAEQYAQLQLAQGKLAGVTMSGLQIIESIKARGGEDDFFKKWAGYMTKSVNSEQRLASLSIWANAVPRLLHALSILAILTIGSRQVIDGMLTIGMLVAFQSLMESFSAPIEELVGLGGKIQEAKGDMNRLDDILQAKTDPQTDRHTIKPEQKPDFSLITHKLEGYIEFKDVTFGYSRLAPPLIENFSLKIAPGERVALVGGSGSGKSTIAKLLAGLYEPWSGEILLDGVPRRQIPREVINNSLAMVDQDIFLFEGTTNEILTLWDNTIPDYLITQAAKDAQIHDIIGSRKDGYESKIVEGGRNLSGGQRQRLEIARALVGNPSLLILDEATSALDPLTEKEIENALRRRSCSVLVVAHRLSTIRDSDEIIVMRYGQIIERGTHEALRALDGAYSALIKT